MRQGFLQEIGEEEEDVAAVLGGAYISPEAEPILEFGEEPVAEFRVAADCKIGRASCRERV